MSSFKPIPGAGREEGGGITLTCRGQVLPPTLTVKHAASIAGCGVSAAYIACHEGRWPALRITERRIVVCTAPFLALMGLELDPDEPGEAPEPEEEEGDEPEFLSIRLPRSCGNAPDPSRNRTMIRHPKRGSGAPVKGNRSPNSIQRKTAVTNS